MIRRGARALSATLSTLFLAASLWAPSPVSAQQQAQTADCASPRRAVDTFLHWEQPDDARLDLASVCFDDLAGTGEHRARVAARLKDVLDLRALFVDLDKIPDLADFVEPGTGEARWVLFPRALPQAPAKIEHFCTDLLAMLRERPAVRPELLEVKLAGIGESSLDVLVCFFLDVPDWSAELKEKHEIYLDILRLAASQGVSFAFPTQTVHLLNDAGAAASAAREAALERPKRA